MITCLFENGKKALLRHVVVDVMLIKDGKILLVKRAPHLLEGGKYGLVGGYVDRDETIEEAVRREILEETGYTIEELKLFRVNDNPHRRGEDRQNISIIYVASTRRKISEPDTESTEVKWFPLSSLPPPEEIAFDHMEQIERYRKEKLT